MVGRNKPVVASAKTGVSGKRRMFAGNAYSRENARKALFRPTSDVFHIELIELFSSCSSFSVVKFITSATITMPQIPLRQVEIGLGEA